MLTVAIVLTGEQATAAGEQCRGGGEEVAGQGRGLDPGAAAGKRSRSQTQSIAVYSPGQADRHLIEGLSGKTGPDTSLKG